MTGEDILKISLGMMLEDDGEDYRPYTLLLLNLLLVDTFAANNSIRLHKGKLRLEDIPTMTDLLEQCPYEDELARMAIPCGLASKLLYDPNDTTAMDIFNNHYVDAVGMVAKPVIAPIVDCYGGDDY